MCRHPPRARRCLEGWSFREGTAAAVALLHGTQSMRVDPYGTVRFQECNLVLGHQLQTVSHAAVACYGIADPLSKHPLLPLFAPSILCPSCRVPRPVVLFFLAWWLSPCRPSVLCCGGAFRGFCVFLPLFVRGSLPFGVLCNCCLFLPFSFFSQHPLVFSKNQCPLFLTKLLQNLFRA